MATVTLRPDATVSNNGVAVTGAASADAALSDDSDASFISSIGADDSATVSFDDISLTPGAVIQSILLRLRVKAPSSAATGLKLVLAVPGLGNLTQVVQVVGSVIYTFTAIPSTSFGTFTEDNINGITLKLMSPPSGGKGGSVAFTGTVYEAYLDVAEVEPPTVTVTAPTGAVVDTTTPTVTWDPGLDAFGGAQTRFEVRVFTDAQYLAGGFNPSASTATAETGGTIDSGDEQWTVTENLANDTYRAYVRIGQEADLYPTLSDWAFTEWTQDVEGPATPTITATGENAQARIRIDIDANAGDSTTDQFELQRSLDGGTTWTQVRTVLGTGIVAVNDNAAYDYEVGNGQSAIYRARAGHLYGSVVAFSDWAVSADASWSGTDWWLKSPTNPTLNTTITVFSLPSYQSAARQGSFQALGAANPIVVSDTRGGDTGTVVIWLDTEADQAAIDALLDLATPLLLQGVPGEHWRDRYVAIGNQDRSRIVDKSWIEPTLDTYPWSEVDNNTGLTVAEWPDVLYPSDDLFPSSTLFPG